MKRRRAQERDEEIAREQADARREALLAELRAREAAVREPEPPAAEPEADAEPDAEPAAESEPEPEQRPVGEEPGAS
jgi:hypothetical protein